MKAPFFAFWTLVATAPGMADTLSVTEAIPFFTQSFYCDTGDGDPTMIVTTAKPGMKIFAYPGEFEVALIDGLFVSQGTPDGLLVFGPDTWVQMADGKTTTGTCAAFNDEIASLLEALNEADPRTLQMAAASFYPPAPPAHPETPEQADFKRLQRENDKLKKRICELDPEATFSVCAKK